MSDITTTVEQDRARLKVLRAEFAAAGGRGVDLAEQIDELRRKIHFHGQKFYRTVITVEVLSDRPYDPDSLEDVSYDILDGDCSGDWSVTEAQAVDSERMAELLVAQGSDPSFMFGDWGYEADDDDEGAEE